MRSLVCIHKKTQEGHMQMSGEFPFLAGTLSHEFHVSAPVSPDLCVLHSAGRPHPARVSSSHTSALESNPIRRLKTSWYLLCLFSVSKGSQSSTLCWPVFYKSSSIYFVHVYSCLCNRSNLLSFTLSWSEELLPSSECRDSLISSQCIVYSYTVLTPKGYTEENKKTESPTLRHIEASKRTR